LNKTFSVNLIFIYLLTKQIFKMKTYLINFFECSLRKKFVSILLNASIIIFLGTINLVQAQKISPYLVGNNVWLDPSTSVWNYGAQCGLQMIRIGGEAYDNAVSGQTGTWIQKIVAMGAQPMLQVPQSYSGAQAAALVRQFPNVKYWNIGNEPGLAGQYAATVSALIKRCAPAMRDVNPNIKIFVADECDLWYGGRYYEQLFSVTGGQYDVSGKDASGRWMIDGISWHRYANGDISGDVASRIKEGRELADKVSAAKGRTGDARIQVGIGEFNHNGGAGVHTFINGQAFGCIFGECMKYEYTYACTWSMFENGGSRGGTDFSYIDGPTGKPRATYYHMQMVAKNFSGDYAEGTTNQANVVSYGCKDLGKGVLSAMIMNKTNTAYSFGLRFDNNAVSTGTLHINLNAGISGQYTDNIPANSTICLVFSASGSKRILYTSANFSASQAPTTTTITSPFTLSGNKFPIGALTAPVNNTNVEVNTDVTVSATASDEDGTVSKVEFFAGTTLIGTDNTSPYSINWTPTIAGTYAITAKVTDNEGASTTTAASSLVVKAVIVYINVPAKIEAEAYSTMFGIQTETTTDVGGGLNIGYTEPGDYLDYDVNVTSSDPFSIDFRVASAVATGKIELRNEAGVALATLTQGTTGGWQTWVTKTIDNVILPLGKQTLRLHYTGAGINLNWFEIKSNGRVLTTITVNPATPSIAKGQTQQFTAVGKDQFGVEMPFTPTWSTNAPNGLFAGTTAGTFTISAQSGTIVGSASITVSDDLSFPIPGKIEAEAYSAMQGIQTQPTTDTGGGLNIGYVDAGDWLDYKVNVSAAGKYNVSFRVASQLATGAFQLKVGATVLATVKVPNTGGWQTWQTVVVPVTLTQGIQTLRIAATGAGLNINWFSFVEAPFSIKIEAESYTSMFGIQTQATTDAGGGLNVGYSEPGDWMNYSVTVPTAGVYTVNFRVASLVATGKIELRNSAETALATLAQGATGGWQTWVTKSVTATLPAGLQTLRIYYTGAGLNINWFELVAGGLKSSEIAGENGTISENEKVDVYPNPVSNELFIQNAAQNSVVEIYNLSGKLVLVEKLKADHNALNVSRLKSGMYLLKAIGNDKTQLVKFIKK
jgi:hypothetical protein